MIVRTKQESVPQGAVKWMMVKLRRCPKTDIEKDEEPTEGEQCKIRVTK